MCQYTGLNIEMLLKIEQNKPSARMQLSFSFLVTVSKFSPFILPHCLNRFHCMCMYIYLEDNFPSVAVKDTGMVQVTGTYREISER